MSSSDASRLAAQDLSQLPRIRIAPATGDTYGDLAHEFGASYGLTQDPWQRCMQDDWLRIDSGGKWAYLTVGVSCPRQNGKNGALEVREIFGMVGLGEAILHTAHEVKTARKHFKRLKHFFGERVDDPKANYPELNALVQEIRNANGQEAIFLKPVKDPSKPLGWRPGGSVEIVARTAGSARGWTVDVLVCDEAQSMSEEDQEALLSATSAAPLGNPQWIYLGTPPGPKVNGEVFARIRTKALEETDPRRCWHEWSAQKGCDLDDEQVWRAANPGLITGRLLWQVVVGERGGMSDEGFSRERLGMWSAAHSAQVISDEAWAAAEVMGVIDGPVTFAVDVAPEMASASVAFAGQMADGSWLVEVAEQRSGADWVPAYIAKVLKANPQVRTVVLDLGSPAKAIADDLTKLKVRVTTPRVADVGAACDKFVDGVRLGQVHHIGQVQLTIALAAARKRKLGATGLWAWNRRDTTSDITPIVACTLALWGAQNSKVTKPRGRRTGKVVVA